MAASSAEIYIRNFGIESWSDITPAIWLELMENLPSSTVERRNIVQRLIVLAMFDKNRREHGEAYDSGWETERGPEDDYVYH